MKTKQIEKLFPYVYQRTATPGSPLSALLEVMQDLHTPIEATLGQLDALFDPRRAPDAFVPFLAGWVDFGVLLDVSRTRHTSAVTLSTGLGRLRELIACAARLSEWRGTKKGLQLFLETATGAKGFIIDEQVSGTDGKPKPFHIHVTAPEELLVHRPLIERIIELEKPAYVTYEMTFQS